MKYISAEGPFGSGTAAKQKCLLSWSTYKETYVDQITRHGAVTYAAMTELKPRYKHACGIKICKLTTSHTFCTN